MSCLFESLTKFVNYLNKNENMDSLRLRNIICDYLSTNPNLMNDNNIDTKLLISASNNINLDQYINIMRNTSSWGGGIELKCFCELTGLGVNVHLINKKIIEFRPSKSNNMIINIFYTGDHYEAM